MKKNGGTKRKAKKTAGSKPAAKKKTSRKKTLSAKEKKTYFLVGLCITAACALLLIVSFVLMPLLVSAHQEQSPIEKADTTASDTDSVPAKKNLNEEQEKSEENIKPADNRNSETVVQKEGKKTQREKTQEKIPKPEKPKKKENAETGKPTEIAKKKPAHEETPAEPSHDTKTEPSHETKGEPAGTLVFVFDDAGHNVTQLQHFLTLPFPCTFAVLPGVAHTNEVVEKIAAAGYEVILHQPMQAVNLDLDPGGHAITKGMTADEAAQVVAENLDGLGKAVGLNNHEGSLITADETIMRAVLTLVKTKDLFFLDSRTNSETVVPKLAVELGVRLAERNIFIDNSNAREDMKAQILKGVEYAKAHGTAVMIGHVFNPQLADLLKEMYPELAAQGFVFKTASQVAK